MSYNVCMSQGPEKSISPQDEQIMVRGIHLLGRTLAHRVNNRLAIVAGTLDILSANPHLSPEEREFLKDANDHLDALSQDIRSVGQIRRIVTESYPVGDGINLTESIKDPNTQERA